MVGASAERWAFALLLISHILIDFSYHIKPMFMGLAGILSTRSYLKAPLYHLIYEWEDDLATALRVPVLNALPPLRRVIINRLSRKVLRVAGQKTLAAVSNMVETANLFRPSNGYYLVYELGANVEPNFSTSPKAIPAFIDLWQQNNWQAFEVLYRACPLVLISSLETLEYMKSTGCSLNLAHFPLSLSDRHRAAPGTVYEKEYDILLAGKLDVRTSQILRDYLQTFSQKYPKVEYLYQQEIAGEFHYVSNLRGPIGKFQSRESYIGLLQASKISFYSTPGLDGGEKRTGGFNPVTPRYLELLNAQCLLLGRYPDNAETRFYEVDKVCPNITSYEQFEQTILQYLAMQTAPLDLYTEILQKHYTSQRAIQLQELLKQLN